MSRWIFVTSTSKLATPPRAVANWVLGVLGGPHSAAEIQFNKTIEQKAAFQQKSLPIYTSVGCLVP